MSTQRKGVDPSGFTVVYSRIEPGIGEIGVCIRGVYDLDDKSVSVLNCELLTYERAGDRSLIIPIDNERLRREILTVTISFCFIMEADIVTSEKQPTRTDADGTEVYTLEIPEYGTIEVEFTGVIDIDDVFYQLCFAHPSMPLVIILEITETDPITFREIDLGNKDLIERIIGIFLYEIGIEVPEAEEEDELKEQKASISPWFPDAGDNN